MPFSARDFTDVGFGEPEGRTGSHHGSEDVEDGKPDGGKMEANRASSDCSVMTREEVTGKSKFKKRSHDKSSQERIPSRMAKGAFGRLSEHTLWRFSPNLSYAEVLTEMFHSLQTNTQEECRDVLSGISY